MKSPLLILAVIFFIPISAHADLIGTYKAEVISVYDGDTFKASVPIWVDLVTNVSVRVRGVDTPEIRGKCEQEKMLAVEAREAAKQFLAEGDVLLSDVEKGKYAGRVVAKVTVNGLDLADHLIQMKLGVHYTGGKRQNWCG